MNFPNPTHSAAGQESADSAISPSHWDIRDSLRPHRLTMIMWDTAYIQRHHKGGSFENYDRVLDEALERGYNTIRIDPMPQVIDLSDPSREISFPDPGEPYMPWCGNAANQGSAGEWLIEFIEKLRARNLHYTLSSWWFHDPKKFALPARSPSTHVEAAELWIQQLSLWKQRLGFDGLLYVDIHNECPFFIPDYISKKIVAEAGEGWGTKKGYDYVATDINAAMQMLMTEFPELRFTVSMHDNVDWTTLPLEIDCLDVHFFGSCDPRWDWRTKFGANMGKFMTETAWHVEFNGRCAKARSVAPMLRARQRARLARFAQWARERGTPLTTTEAWACWYYNDSPDLDWSWLLDWAAWSVDDAIEFKMWGWTPHNYLHPHFSHWQNVAWHRQLNDKFLKS
ncbi:cellulase-like family protein [Oscillatoria laete-virens NRMC-F 0139]|nr:cellulase-like family protein [Oscillatoria laete-virens]MDL5054695.1 cellulase-like family protein [Oscillatoria laete-virens NRMC-F 0139]